MSVQQVVGRDVSKLEYLKQVFFFLNIHFLIHTFFIERLYSFFWIPPDPRGFHSLPINKPIWKLVKSLKISKSRATKKKQKNKKQVKIKIEDNNIEKNGHFWRFMQTMRLIQMGDPNCMAVEREVYT